MGTTRTEQLEQPSPSVQLRPPRLLEPGDVARAASVAESTIYRAIRRGTLPHVKIGKCIRVPIEAAEAYLAGQLQCSR